MHSELKQKLEHLLESVRAAQVSIACHDMADGAEVLIRPDIPYHPASTIKACVMLEAYRQACSGEFSLEDLLLVKNEFHSLADGSLFSLSPADDSETDLYDLVGKQLPLCNLILRMIASSSNLATNLLIEKVGASRVTQFMHELGASDLLVLRGPEDNKAFSLGMNNSATARSLMQILVHLASGLVINPTVSNEMITILKQQRFNEGIPAKLPAGVSVAHKTGWNDQDYHDAAIVYPPHHDPYVLVIMTHGLPSQDEAPKLVAEISSIIFRSGFS